MIGLHQITPLRRVVLKLLRWLNPGAITIRHHWTGDRFVLDAFKHRNYWYLGRRRESEAMLLLPRLIRSGDVVLDVGGHIGYLALYFARLAGDTGQVIVFEPGPNNLPFTRRNLSGRATVRLEEVAVADFTGSVTLHVEALTGQNNSILANYRLFELAARSHSLTDSDIGTTDVPCVTLDDFLLRRPGVHPTFVKIDVEGAEYQVLLGMQELLRSGIALLIEVTERFDDVFALLRGAGYRMFRADRSEIVTAAGLSDATFCVKAGDPRIAAFEG